MSDSTSESKLLSSLSKNNLILLCIAFLIAVLIFLVESLTDIAVLLAATLLVAYLLMGPMYAIEQLLSRIRKNGKPFFSPGLQRTFAILLVYLSLAGIVAITAIQVIPYLALQVQEFADDIPQYLQRLQNPQIQTLPMPQTLLPTDKQWMATTSTHLVQKIAAVYSQYLSKLGSYLINIGTSALSGLIYTLTMLVLVFILLQDGAQLKRGFVELMPNRIEHSVSRFLSRFHRHAYRFIQAQALVSFLVGTMIYLFLLLLDSKYALLLGVSYGLVSLIPVIGPWIGLLALIGMVAFGEHPERVLPLIFYVGAFHCLKTYWLWPRMLPKHADIHPVIFLVVLLASIRLAGPLGVLLAFPLASVLGVAFDYWREAAK
jgi:predicted PurR-regulated permease PerM